MTAATTTPPKFLTEIDRWTTWNLVPNRGGKPTKKPNGSTLDPSIRQPFAEVADVPISKTGGVGFVMTDGVHVVQLDQTTAWLLAFDCDGRRNPATGELTPWVEEMIEHYRHTYTEVTPSGTGVRIWLLVRNPPKGIPKIKVPHDPLPGVTKTPEIQTFGCGPAGFVTVTFDQLEGAVSRALLVDDLEWLFERWHVSENEASDAVALPEGEGEPPTVEQIRQRVEDAPHGPEMIAGDWAAVGKPSASELWMALVIATLRAANHHGAAAVRFLLTETAFGIGHVDSKDPDRYTRRGWVEKDVARIAGKVGEQRSAASMFDDGFDAADWRPTDTAEDKRRALVALGVVDGIGVSLADIFRRWSTEGPLDHYPTGIDWLDERTGGGPVPGTRWFLNGAPDAGKTLLGLQVAHTMAEAGVEVGILTIDEESDDSGTRFAQRIGLDRAAVEGRDPMGLLELVARFESLPLTVYERGTTIEAAAKDLRHRAGDRPAFLFIDSLQTAPSKAENGAGTKRERVEARVAAIRSAAISRRLMVLTSSEVPRDYYRNRKRAEELDPLASGKESGDIDFAGRVILMLDVPDENRPEFVRLRIGKNKQRPADAPRSRETWLRIDLGRQTIEHAPDFSAPVGCTGKARATMLRDARDVLDVIRSNPRVGVTALRTKVRASVEGSISNDRVDVAAEWLVAEGAVEVPATVAKGEPKPHTATGVVPQSIAEVFGDTLPDPAAADLGSRQGGSVPDP